MRTFPQVMNDIKRFTLYKAEWETIKNQIDHRKYTHAIGEIDPYFESGNRIEVEKANIPLKEFWPIAKDYI